MIPEKIMETLSDEWVVNKNEPDTISNGPRILRIFQNQVTPSVYNGDEGETDGVMDADHEKAFTVCINVLDEIYSGENAPLVIPQVLTPSCFKDHPGPEAVLHAARETNPIYIEHKPGPGGKIYPYVKGHYIDTVVNYAFMFRAGFAVDEIFREGDEVICVGHIILPFSDGACEEAHSGHADIYYRTESDGQGGKCHVLDNEGDKIPVSIGATYQAAITNCKKKCWSKKNIANDVYSGEVE